MRTHPGHPHGQEAVAASGDELLRAVDPFAALMDGRRQLLGALETGVDEARANAALASVTAHDDALREVAVGYASGRRDFTSVPLPTGRGASGPDTQDASAARDALLEALAGITDALDDPVTTPWGGAGSWRLQLITHAIYDGLHAEALLRGEPPPGPIAARSDPR